jgi:polysaccharide deacetylase 2 family uncharacterized protein YibQ
LLIGALFSTVSAAAVSLMLPPLAPLQMPASPEPVAGAPEAVSAPEVAEAPVMPEAPEAEVMAEAPEAEVVAEAPGPVALPEDAATVVDPAAPPAAEEAPVAPEPAETAMAAPEPDSVPAPVAEAAPDPAPEPEAAPETSTETAMAGAVPETPVVDVPAGSEFNRPKPETDPLVPAQEPAPVASSAPEVSAPLAEEGPALTELAPAAPPEAQGEAPAILPEPAPAAPMAMAEAPAPDSAIPVPPPGENLPPPLMPVLPEGEAAVPTPSTAPEAVAPPRAPVEEAAVTPEVAPEPEAVLPAPDPAPAPTEEAVILPEPEVVAPASEPVAEAVPEPEPQPAPAPVEEAAVAPETITEPVIDPAPQPERAKLPQIIAPDAGADSAAPEDSAILTPPGGAAANRSRILTPGNSAPSDGGPVIIDVAPQQPIGATGRPQVGFGQRGGVQINRLPRIGDDSAAANPAPEAAPAESGADQAVDSAVSRYRAAFDNAGGKPVIAVILIEDGSAASAEPDAIAAIGAPVTVALNPERADAATLAQTFRLSGDEIAIYEPAMPPGATASDREVSYQSFVQSLPETVALVAAPGSALQGDRRVAEHMSALLATEGRGLVTEARGLNPGRQAAGRANAPYAGIARSLDEAGGDDQAIQRFLDRAAFDAARSGSIVLIGHATPEVVSALKGWIEAGKKEAVIGPVSAVLAP